MSASHSALATVRPGRQLIFRASLYVMPFIFYGPLAMFVLLPFELPPKHVAYYVAYALGVGVSVVWTHWAFKKMRNGCYFTLTNDVLELGKKPKTTILINEVTDAIPVAYHPRLFRPPKVEASPERFNLLLLRLRDGSRLALAPVTNLQGFEQFFQQLLNVLKPAFKEVATFSDHDMAAMRANCINKIQLIRA